MELLAKLVLGSKNEETLAERAREYGREQGKAGCTTREEVLERIKQGSVGYWGLKDGKGEEVIKYVTALHLASVARSEKGADCSSSCACTGRELRPTSKSPSRTSASDK